MSEKSFDGSRQVDITASCYGGDRRTIEVGAGHDGVPAMLSATEAREVARELIAAADWLDVQTV